MAATSKTQLLEVTEREFEKLEKLIRDLEEDFAMKRREDDTSIKDVIAHRAHWIDLFLGWHSDGLAGKEVSFPARGYKWNELNRYNADLRISQARLDWRSAVAMLQNAYGKLIAFIQKLSDEDLYGGPMKGARNAWTTGRWAEAAGPSHFRSAAKYIRSVIRSHDQPH